jgi:IMP dehydrogenase
MAFVSAEVALTFDDVLLVPAYSEVVPREVSLRTRVARDLWLDAPLLSAAMDTVTEHALAKALARLGGLGVIHKNLSIEQQVREVASVVADGMRCAAAVGVGAELAQRASALLEAGCCLLVVDTAHGHSKGVIDAVRLLRQRWPTTPLVAGNVATAEGTVALLEAGADAVKVGIGPGSICTTRVVAGVGVPQLTAVLECAAAAQRYGAPVIADGGIRASGDVVKALAAGAAAVMLGSAFAGADESPGAVFSDERGTWKVVRGMGSLPAMRQGSADRYGQSGAPPDKLVAEGVVARVPARGPLGPIVAQLLGGCRAGLGYVGARDLTELRARAKFVRITTAGLQESHVHDVTAAADPVDKR